MCIQITEKEVEKAFKNIKSHRITTEEVQAIIQKELHTELKHVSHIKAFIKINMERNGYIYDNKKDRYIRGDSD